MKKFTIALSLILFASSARSQNGLEKIIVEKYYISNAADSVGSDAAGAGVLPVGSVTYRLYVDMKPGYKFQALYGVNTPVIHELRITSTEKFFNNEDRGATSPTYSKTQAKGNTIMLDSWFSVGAGCTNNFGILKTDDDGISTVVNSDGILQNNDAAAGIPLTTQDGLIAGGFPEAVTFVGLTNELEVFNATSLYDTIFTTTDGSIASLNGSVGPNADTNRVLVGQFTTKGKLCFKLNIQLGTPGGGTENYVAENPQAGEIYFAGLTYCSIATNTPETKKTTVSSPILSFSTYPAPVNDELVLEFIAEKNTTSSYALYSTEGKTILQKDLGIVQGKQTEKIDMTSFAKGLYIIEVTSGGKSSHKKVMKN